MICFACLARITEPAGTILGSLARKGFKHVLCGRCAEALAWNETKIANLVASCYAEATVPVVRGPSIEPGDIIRINKSFRGAGLDPLFPEAEPPAKEERSE